MTRALAFAIDAAIVNLTVLFDRHRRALQDFVARSVVVRVPG